ncbi:MAG: carboxypeptidase-like regulatory domain-containing protein [Bacteroidaceae bacterium]|nr:carboxypeptidase-like regulatory domain-containing protein [Bacteroidaceae bacterium]
MRKTLTLFALLMLAFICPAAAQQIVIDEITIQGAESYTVNEEMVVRFEVNNKTGVPLKADEYSLKVNVGGVYAGKPAATKDIANGSYETFMAKIAPHKAGENLPVEIVFEGMGTVKEVAPTTVTVNPEVPSGDVQIGNCAKPSSDTDYTNVLNTYYNYSQTEIVYTAADLDLADGTAMTGLSFTGYKEDGRIVPVKVWVELTDDVKPQSTNKTTMYTSDNLIKVYDDNYSFKAVGDTYSHESVFSITFPTPINYVAGKSLRVIVQTEKASAYSYTYISVDKTKGGQVATRCVDSDLEGLQAKAFKADSYGTPYYLPILKLAIEKDPTIVSGQVYIITKNNEVAYPENATVTLANGNVMYFAQTDEDGNYSMPVCRDKLTYEVTVEPQDYVIFPYSETLALNGTSTTKNIGLKEAAGAYILSAEFPETGVENTPVTVKANIANYEAEDMDDTNAKVILKLDGKQVAEAEDLLIDAFDNDNVTLTFNPHVSGTKELTVEVYVNDVLQHSKSGNITISKESATNDFTIKGSEVTANETTSPIRLYSTHSYSQTLLTSDMLSGLAAGSKITGLKLESAQSSNTKNFNFDVKVWVMNTEDGVDNVTAPSVEDITTDPHSADFKQVYSATLVQRYHGKYNDGSVTYEKFFDLVFDEPFIYEGNNIRIAMRADIQGDGYQQTYFKAIKDVRTSWSKSSDNPTIDGAAVDIMDYTWASSAALTPVFTLVVDNASIVTGAVVNKDTQAPIANAEVKLTANDGADIVYTATTDAEGKFSVSVIQASHSFTASVSAEGYKAVENAGSISADFDSPFDLGTIELEIAVEGALVNVDPVIGYATFYDSEHAVNVPAGVEAYVFTQLLDMTMPGLVEYSKFAEACGEEYEGVIPAGEPIVLKGSGDVVLEYAEAPDFDSFAEMGANFLAGTDTDVTTPAPVWAEDYYEADEFYYYALSLNEKNEPESVGFYWVDEEGSAFTNKAHEAYLAIPKEMFEPGDAKSAFLFNGESATAIKNVNRESSNAKLMFNLAGQRVNKSAKGIIIKNGKKFMVK